MIYGSRLLDDVDLVTGNRSCLNALIWCDLIWHLTELVFCFGSDSRKLMGQLVRGKPGLWLEIL